MLAHIFPRSIAVALVLTDMDGFFTSDTAGKASTDIHIGSL